MILLCASVSLSVVMMMVFKLDSCAQRAGVQFKSLEAGYLSGSFNSSCSVK
jgi:hypothetical protein